MSNSAGVPVTGGHVSIPRGWPSAHTVSNILGIRAFMDPTAIAGTEGYTPKMEDWGSVNRTAFPTTHGVNGIDKSSIETDIKYPQYSVYSGAAGSYVSPGHHWQAQGSSAMTIHSGEIHSAMSFKHTARDGDRKPPSPLSKQQHEVLSSIHGLSLPTSSS
ncbi:Paired box protein Pax-1 [Bagarius yarrelli]|uniref:Paired box protein Pax-1 n=1 Tax=Bagarius yarrelli TaxID=175774 RepID=A0A556U9A4_BAGYA|nr:Paired box protein Pax-1 [Bagarius yarrelli]